MRNSEKRPAGREAFAPGPRDKGDRAMFRLRKTLLLVVFYVVILLVCSPAVAAKSKPPLYDLQPNAVYQVSVQRVVDGDTIVVDFPTGERERVRLIGVNTPETVHPKKPVEYYGKEASAFTKKELAGRKVWLQMDVQVRDRYRRALGYVWMEKPGENEKAVRRGMFNARLILEGYGQVMTIQPNSRYAEMFVGFQREAREQKKGLWE
nr:MAG TPA: SNc [Caudoviricetes sp.]